MTSPNFKALQEHILSLSVAKSWPLAVREWELFGIEKSEEPGSCPCGQTILEHCFLRNRVNDEQTHVGNVCVNRFMALDTKGLFNGLRKIAKDDTARPNQELIEYALKAGFLFGTNEYEFLVNMRGRRSLSAKQIAWVQKINRRILNKTIVRRPSSIADLTGGAA